MDLGNYDKGQHMTEFTPQAEKMIQEGVIFEVKRLKHLQVMPEHLLLTILREAKGTIAQILQSLKLDVNQIQIKIEEWLVQDVSLQQNLENQNQIVYSKQFDKLVLIATREARNRGISTVGVEFLFLATYMTSSFLQKFFATLGVTGHDLKKVILDTSEKGYLPLSKEEQGSFVERTGNRGRVYTHPNDKKTQILQKYTTNITDLARAGKVDPIVGREIEIQRIFQIFSRRYKNNVILVGPPGVGKTALVEYLAYKIIKEDCPPALQGKEIVSLDLLKLTSGTRYRGDLEERLQDLLQSIQQKKNVIVFIDEIHMILHTGASEGSSLDVANVLKPELAMGNVSFIGCTTIVEFKKFIEQDMALERRFQPIFLDEPTEKETLDILKGIRHKYEEFHRVKYTDEILQYLVRMTNQYVTQRFFPDKAIDVLDELGAYSQASSLKKSEAKNKKTTVITLQQVDDILSQMLGVALRPKKLADRQLLQNIEQQLAKKVVGQKEVLHILGGLIRQYKLGFVEGTRPLGSFLFMGGPGLGKTYLSKLVAKELYGSEKMFFHIDLSNFQEKHYVSNLIGSPKGYVGYEEGGILTEFVRKNPFSVILFDELDKAHPSIYEILLPILEEGVIRDSLGRNIIFRNTVIIFTMNIPERFLQIYNRMGFHHQEEDQSSKSVKKEAILADLKKNLQPEFLDRIDEMVLFQPFQVEEIQELTKMKLEDLKEKLQKRGIIFDYSDELIPHLYKEYFSQAQGARSIIRAIRRYVQEPMYRYLLEQDRYHEDLFVKVYVSNNEVGFEYHKEKKQTLVSKKKQTILQK